MDCLKAFNHPIEGALNTILIDFASPPRSNSNLILGPLTLASIPAWFTDFVCKTFNAIKLKQYDQIITTETTHQLRNVMIVYVMITYIVSNINFSQPKRSKHYIVKFISCR